ncbi:amidohydrolase [Peptoniphilus sp. ING2-D1G]|nr:amidohydrolase [Peptoniphilus sp. ING2-D1G]
MKFKICTIQMSAKGDKDENLEKAKRFASIAKSDSADVIVLPEMWNCPYRNDYFVKFAEEKYGKTYRIMQEIAKKKKVLLIGGSIPIKSGDKIYNETFVFNEEGEEIHSYRKINLFDVNIEGKVSFKESENIKAGSSMGTFETKFGRFGVVICYDLRFPELFQNMYALGAKVVFVPATFTVPTGQMHWELLLKARAVDYQYYVVGASIARDDELSKNAYGHSMTVNPMGEVISSLDEKEGMISSEIDLNEVEKVRKEIPLENSRNMRKLI